MLLVATNGRKVWAACGLRALGAGSGALVKICTGIVRSEAEPGSAGRSCQEGSVHRLLVTPAIHAKSEVGGRRVQRSSRGGAACLGLKLFRTFCSRSEQRLCDVLFVQRSSRSGAAYFRLKLFRTFCSRSEKRRCDVLFAEQTTVRGR